MRVEFTEVDKAVSRLCKKIPRSWEIHAEAFRNKGLLFMHRSLKWSRENSVRAWARVCTHVCMCGETEEHMKQWGETLTGGGSGEGLSEAPAVLLLLQLLHASVPVSSRGLEIQGKPV